MIGGNVVEWFSKLQKIVTDSSTYAEYIALNETSKSVVFVRNILESLGFKQLSPTSMNCDNDSAYYLSKNPIVHGKSKHFDLRFHMIRGYVSDKIIEVTQCDTKENVSDIFTKALTKQPFHKHTAAIFQGSVERQIRERVLK